LALGIQEARHSLDLPLAIEHEPTTGDHSVALIQAPEHWKDRLVLRIIGCRRPRPDL
jgi:hypothetical protein